MVVSDEGLQNCTDFFLFLIFLLLVLILLCSSGGYFFSLFIRVSLLCGLISSSKAAVYNSLLLLILFILGLDNDFGNRYVDRNTCLENDARGLNGSMLYGRGVIGRSL